MRRNSLLIMTGSAFKAVLQTVGVFLLLLSISVYALLSSIENTLHSELKQQVIEETQLLSNVYQYRGLDGLTQALQQVRSAERFAAVYQNGISTTGERVPPSITIHRASRLEIMRYDNGRYFAIKRTQLDELELIVGRSTHVVEVAKQRVLVGATIMGLAFIVLALLIGYYFSRRASTKLGQFERTLTSIANGDLSARLPVTQPPEQIDVIADNMNTQLQRLQRLVDGIKHTSKAIAHDLKTPLSRSQIALHGALDACEAQQNPAPLIQQALDENVGLNRIFDTLLRISRLQSQAPDTAALSSFPLQPMLVEVADFLRPNAETNHQTLHIDCAPTLQGFGDKDMLQQAAMNLINNAILYAGEKTKITVAAQRTDDGFCLSICDTGVGIPESAFADVLTAFTRLDSSRSSEGNGLGLALVQAIVDYHGGTLSLHNNSPAGLCVRLVLPLTREE